MKAQIKNRKHPTCNRCRHHGLKDIRVLQHQCPYRNCTCSNCHLTRQRSLINRAQKNLDKTEDKLSEGASSSKSKMSTSFEDNSSDATSSGGSNDNTQPTRSFKRYKREHDIPSNEVLNKSTSCSSIIGSEISAPDSIAAFGQTSAGAVSTLQSHWEQADQYPSHQLITSKSGDHFKIGDFQTLCVTFPDFKPSDLQYIFEKCEKDFQKTIDELLDLQMKRANGFDSRESKPFPTQYNDWPQDYAASGGVLAVSSYQPSMAYHEQAQNNYRHANNTDQSYYEWGQNSSYSSSEDYTPDSFDGSEVYYEQNYQTGNSCDTASYQTGVHQPAGPSCTYYAPYWYGNSQGNCSGAVAPYDSGANFDEEVAWQNGQNMGHGQGQLALGTNMQMHGVGNCI